MKNQISLWAACLLVTTLFLLPQAAQAQCTNASFVGTFQFNDSGLPIEISIFPDFQPDSVGKLVSTGDGHFTFTETAYGAIVPGTLLPLPGLGVLSVPLEIESTYEGDYTVNPDCTMTMIFHSSNDNCFAGFCFFPIHFDAVLVKGQTAFYFITTDTTSFGSGAGKKI